MKNIELKVGDEVEINWDKVSENLIKDELPLSIVDDMKEYYKENPIKKITKINDKNLFTEDKYSRYDVGRYVFLIDELTVKTK